LAARGVPATDASSSPELVVKKRNLFLVILLYVVTLGFSENYLYKTFVDSLLADRPRSHRRWSLVNAAAVLLWLALLGVLLLEAVDPELDLVDLGKVLQLAHLALTMSLSFRIRQAINQEFFRRPGDRYVGRYRTLFFQFLYLQYCINRLNPRGPEESPPGSPEAPAERKTLARRLPWVLVVFRAVLGPLAVAAALVGFDPSGGFFAGLVAVGLLSDVFDGVVARRLGVSTDRLRIADSRADVVFFAGLVAALFLRAPALFVELAVFVAVIAVLEAAVHLISFVRFRRQSSTHHVLSKAFSVLLWALLVQLFVVPQVTPFFWVVLGVGVVSFLEAGLIMLTLRRWECDVRSLLDARRRES